MSGITVLPAGVGRTEDAVAATGSRKIGRERDSIVIHLSRLAWCGLAVAALLFLVLVLRTLLGGSERRSEDPDED